MSQILDFGRAAKQAEYRTRPVLRGDETGEFWLEVSRLDEPVAVDPANAPGRVLFEAFLVLAGAALLVAVVTSLIPGPSFL